MLTIVRNAPVLKTGARRRRVEAPVTSTND